MEGARGKDLEEDISNIKWSTVVKWLIVLTAIELLGENSQEK